MDPAAPIPSPIEIPKKWRRRSAVIREEHTPAAAIILAATVVTGAPWLAGGQAMWGQALVVMGIAVLLALWPPKVAPHRWAGWALLGTLALCAAQFLPAAAGGGAALREGLETRLAIQLPPTVSTQPWLSLDHTLVLLAGLGWWWWCATTLPSRHAREEVAKAGLLGITALVLYALGVVAGLVPRLSWWSELVPFGPFPNKNQMGDLTGTWAVVAAGCAVASLQRRRWTGLCWLAAMLVLGWATFESLSRGGTFVLLAGVAVFALREGLATRELRPVTIGLSFALCALSLFLAFGGETLARSVKLIHAMQESTSSDFRILIYRDVLHMIHDAPWPGLGLGDFEPVFALHRESSNAPVRVLHPESDWLWLAAELGWLGPALALLFIVPSLRNPFRSALRERSPILDAASIGGVAFLLHGLVDVSGHRMGSALPGLLLLGVAVRRQSVTGAKRGWPWLFRGGAAGLALLSIGWLAGSPSSVAVWGRAPVVKAKTEANLANAALAFPEAERLCAEALRQAPLDWELYFIRAVAELYQERRDEALADFRRARQLESSDPAGPLEEGRLWAFYGYDHCQEAWEAALSRGRKEDRRNIYANIVAVGRVYPDLLPIIRSLAGDDWDCRAAYLGAVPPADFSTEFALLLADDSTLEKPSDECLKSLLLLCESRGDREQLVQLLEESPRVHLLAWQTLARLKAERKEYEAAVALVISHLHIAVPELAAPPLEAAQTEFDRNPKSLVAGYHQYRAQKVDGLEEAALATLGALKTLPNCPSYVPYLRGKMLAERADWAAAWSELSSLLEH